MSQRDTMSARQKEDSLLQINTAVLKLILMKRKDRKKADTRSIKRIAHEMGQMVKACETGVRPNRGKRDLGSKDADSEPED